MLRGQIPGRCGTCAHFKGNGNICNKRHFLGHKRTNTAGQDTIWHDIEPGPRYANDYGKDVCLNYNEKHT